MKPTFTALALGLAILSTSALVSAPGFARQGADDGAGQTWIHEDVSTQQMARRGADDPAGDDRGGGTGGKGRGGAEDSTTAHG